MTYRTYLNKLLAFFTFSTFAPTSLQLNDFELRKGKRIGVTISFNNHRLFVGNIPKNRDRDELFEEFTKHARKFLKAKMERERMKFFLHKEELRCTHTHTVYTNKVHNNYGVIGT